ncbi:MAG TPA: glutamine--tRNA ligase, partial [Flavisolibacter sp.]
CERVGIAKRENLIDVGLLEFCVREHLNKIALRRMVVFDPLKIVITNFGAEIEWLELEDNPEDPNSSKRKIPFGREIYVEKEDFMENPPKKYFRLFPGGMVRLKGAYIIRCDEAVKDEKGNLTELRCTYIPESKSGHDTSGINVKGTLHWVEISQALPAEVRLYDRLFKVEDPSSEEGDFKDYINADSLQTVTTVYAEPELKNARMNERYQCLRKGYFTLDNKDTYARLVFNRTVTLKDAWAKEQKKL